VLNAAARLVYNLKRSEHITDALISLHWLRALERIKYKVAVLTYKVLHGSAPRYLERLTASPIVLVADSYDRLKLTVFSCHLSGFPQSAAKLFRLLVCKSGTICLMK
jgi:hypothetical protein